MKGKIKPTISREAYNMMTVGYRDYIAARFLLNNDFLMQGLGLSSLAVEKYLKSILFRHNVTLDAHMNNWKQIKSAFSRNKIPLFEELDETYLNLLGKAFSLRYYDKINTDTNISFIKWQVLGELDFFVNLIEMRTSFKNGDEQEIKSLYKVDLETKNPHLFLENYILQGQSKKSFMERESKAIMMLFNKYGVEIFGEGSLRCEAYNGKIVVTKSIEII